MGFKHVIQHFTEFTETQPDLQLGDAGHGLDHFLTEELVPTDLVIKQWLTWYARSGRGHMDAGHALDDEFVAGAKLSMVTLKSRFT